MKAITLTGFGGIENLIATEIPVPVIAENEVLIHVKSISINPIDVKTRAGRGVAGLIKDLLPVVIGWDVSGVITETGSEVSGFKPGDEVFAMITFPTPGKTYAAYVAAPADQLALKPANISHDEAAAATLATLTAWQGLTLHNGIKKGDRVLIHAAAGGVGHYAVQIARYFGAYVIGTSSAANRDFVLSLGADEHIDYRAQAFEEVLDAIDFVFDPMGGDYIDRSLKVIKKGGTMVSLPTGLNESLPEKARQAGVNGFTMKAKVSGEDMHTIAGLLEKGLIKSHISRIFPISEVAKAHLEIESGRTVGKIVLQNDLG